MLSTTTTNLIRPINVNCTNIQPGRRGASWTRCERYPAEDRGVSARIVTWSVIDALAEGFCIHQPGYDRRMEAGCPNVACTVGFHASRFALASPLVTWVRLSEHCTNLYRNITAPRGRHICSHPGHLFCCCNGQFFYHPSTTYLPLFRQVVLHLIIVRIKMFCFPGLESIKCHYLPPNSSIFQIGHVVRVQETSGSNPDTSTNGKIPAIFRDCGDSYILTVIQLVKLEFHGWEAALPWLFPLFFPLAVILRNYR